MEWQPIETAPKDGSVILLFTAYGIIEGYWDFDRWGQSVCSASHDMAYAYIECLPIYWQHLPEPPK